LLLKQLTALALNLYDNRVQPKLTQTNCNLLVPEGLHFLMWNFNAGNVWFKLFPVSHKIWSDCKTEIPHKRK